MAKSPTKRSGNDKSRGKSGAPPAPSSQLEGEGSYTATQRYNAGLKKTLETKNVDELAEAAREALEGKEGDELRKAEERGKRGPGS
ncbi:MAG TPA: hypothetical protein VJU61_04475 [Polyangiaceae bacterium]|nr:hypothetical protein [Polyangiaceae bacterium]